MATIIMLDSQQCDLTVVEKNSQGQVISPNPAISASASVANIVDLIISPDNSIVTVKGKGGLSTTTNVTVTVSAVANPSVAKSTQAFSLNPDPSFPTSLVLTAGLPQ